MQPETLTPRNGGRGATQRAGGFTLIELLIVVAIIAILAAIAVPNFLEAQVRSKVSRVRADMRSLAGAQEAYFTDWNSYTHADPASPSGQIGGWRMLTTPVAYITSLPRDAFGDSRHRGNAAWLGPPLYELGTGHVRKGASGSPWSPKGGMPSNTYEMNSSGPDNFEDTNSPGNVPGHQYTWFDVNYPWKNIPADSPAAVDELLGLLYDPTNGTKSKGEVFRTGGMKPPGRMFDYFFSIGSGQ